MTDLRPVYAGVEGGGTKFMCAIGTGPDDIIDEARFPTTLPKETMDQVVEFFTRPRDGIKIVALGIASFGPIDLDHASKTYGYITTTPKLPWQFTDVAGLLGRALNVPVGFDTDTNGAALGEGRWGAGQGIDPLIYVTIGTGVGFGVVINGEPVHGLMHPEAGHLSMPVVNNDLFKGHCPFHGRCLEGLVSGPSIQDRTGRDTAAIADDDPVWDLVAAYIAHGLYSASLVISPRRIIVGGGVGSRPALLVKVRQHMHDINSGYVAALANHGFLETYLVNPGLAGQAGIAGAFELARRAHSIG